MTEIKLLCNLIGNEKIHIDVHMCTHTYFITPNRAFQSERTKITENAKIFQKKEN